MIVCECPASHECAFLAQNSAARKQQVKHMKHEFLNPTVPVLSKTLCLEYQNMNAV